MNATRIMRRPWVDQITTINIPRLLVRLAPGKVFTATGKREQEFDNVAKAYEGTNRLLISQDPGRYTQGRWGTYGTYLEIRQSDSHAWEAVGKFPTFALAQDYAHTMFGLAVIKGQ